MKSYYDEYQHKVVKGVYMPPDPIGASLGGIIAGALGAALSIAGFLAVLVVAIWFLKFVWTHV